MKNTEYKSDNIIFVTLAFMLVVIVSLSNAKAADNSSANNYSMNKSDFTLPFHLIDGYIFIDAQVNNRKGKFMFDTGTPFTFLVNNHFIPLAKDNYLAEGSAESGQFLVLYTQNKAVSVNLMEQIKFDKLKSLPHTNFNFIQKAVLNDFLGMAGHGFNKDYLFIINYDNQTIDFHSFKQDDKTLSGYINKDKIISTLPFTTKDDGRKPEIFFLIDNEKITGLFDTGNLGTITLTQEMKSRLETGGYLTVTRQEYSYGRYEPYLSATLRKLSINNQTLYDIHNLQFQIGKVNEIGLGYQFLKHYVSAWDYKNKTIALLKK
jgi:predicted aspartyl protease